MKTHKDALGNGRTMRVIPWREAGTDAPCYTLVLEWWSRGRVTKDERRQMDAGEMAALVASALDALHENGETHR